MTKHPTLDSLALSFQVLHLSFLGGKGVNPRRHLGEPLDQTVVPTASCFCVTADNRFILVCGYWDKSFKVFSTDSGE